MTEIVTYPIHIRRRKEGKFACIAALGIELCIDDGKSKMMAIKYIATLQRVAQSHVNELKRTGMAIQMPGEFPTRNKTIKVDLS